MRFATRESDPFVAERLPPAALRPHRPLDALAPRLRGDRLNAGAWLVDRIDRAATAGQTAYRLDTGATVDYAALAGRIGGLAAALAASGARPGNRVLLRLPNGPAMAAALTACWLTGTVAVATPPLLGPAELARILGRCRPDRAVVDPALAADLATAQAETGLRATPIDPDSAPAPLPAPTDTAAEAPALILFTSGTTGEPKAAVHDHRAVLATASLWAEDLLHPVAEDVFAGTPPMAFAYGLAGLMLFPLSVGAATVVPTGRGVRGLADAMTAVPPSVCFTAPTGYRRLAEAVPDAALGRLRLAVSAGEPLSPAVAEAWQARTGDAPIDVLGTTEMLSMVLTADPGSPALRPVRGYAVRLAAAPDLDAGRGAGRLEVQGPTGCHYLDAPAAQQAYVVDGWNRTGDLMAPAEPGRLAYLARADDLILTRGYTVSGPEIEAVIDAQPDVRESAVIGVDDGAGGTELRALVVWDSHIVADETIIDSLMAAVAARLAPWKVPRRVTPVDALPRTATGKLRRGALRAWRDGPPEG